MPSEPPLWEQMAARLAALPQGERLQKVLAQTGWGSRRVCEELIAAGRVTVNGEVAVLGRRVDPDHDLVEIDGAPVGVRPGWSTTSEQADRGGDHHAGPSGPVHGGHPCARPSRGCSRWAAWTPTPRVCCS
jgi:hypothetical protein